MKIKKNWYYNHWIWTNEYKRCWWKIIIYLNSYTNPQQFGCVISLISEPAKNSTQSEEGNKGDNNGNGENGNNGEESGNNGEESGKNGEENGNNGNKSFNKSLRKEGSSGLSIGAIAAIIICVIIVLAIIGVLIGLAKSGKIFCSKPPAQNLNTYTSSSLNNFVYKPSPNEF